MVSPLDGEVPGRVAIIQGHPEDDEDHLLSSVILGVNEAIIALHKTEGLEVVLVSPVCQSFQERFLPEAVKIPGLRIVDGTPASVERVRNDQSLVLQYSENGESKQETFDLIVILSKQKLSLEIESLSKKLEQEVL